MGACAESFAAPLNIPNCTINFVSSFMLTCTLRFRMHRIQERGAKGRGGGKGQVGNGVWGKEVVYAVRARAHTVLRVIALALGSAPRTLLVNV